MPSKPSRLCAHPGCSEIVSSGYCEKHTKEKRRSTDKRRGSSTQRGYNYKWQKASKAFLRQPENRLCKECEKEGRVVLAKVVDHIIPHKGNMKLFWDRTNWQGLCERHHNIKTASEDGGFGNKIK